MADRQHWWRSAVLYQIYPRSFADSNGDGIGDLVGITQRLDYVASLGVDGIWLSPFFPSPMRDFGYDVTDYCGVDPMFGTLADFDLLVEQAHARGLKVIIDQVWSHSAIEHPWFQQSRQDRHGPNADWYVWADAKPDGSPPTNWQSWVGGPTWTWEPRRRQYYLHNFLPQMPDLNLHNPAVQNAMLEIGRFWLERGVDGFRLDTANYYCHDLRLRDNPPQAPEKRGDMPAAMQQHLFNVCQPENLLFLARIRELMDSFDQRMTVAEIGSANNLERMIEYTQGNQRLHTAYSFVLLGEQPAPAALEKLLTPWQHGAGVGAWPSWALSNHDVIRVATRWASGDEQRTKQLLVMLLTNLPGTIFIYQGEELGLPQSEVPFEDIQDPFGKAYWPVSKGRDGCRTPMPWESAKPAAGFTTGEPWLPVEPAHCQLAVDVQETQSSSTLQHTRALLALRRKHPALAIGSLEVLQAEGPLLLVRRKHADDQVLVALNLGSETVCAALPNGFAPGADGIALGSPLSEGASLHLPAWSAWVQPVAAAVVR